MTLKWKRESIIFDSLFEADVWADSIGNEIYAKLYDGYDTLAEMKEFRVFAKKTIDNGYRYKVWVIPS
ncbi:hypothetical protein QWT69_13065 [Sporosarcina oncorhynchi]|uniref:KTSC domain-containing protein n=1 Tax=Sporosarcina oncorhynchi TaxID=3056444 RepID=A0ABZ0L2F4_9BACL|nr:hypothetical protein [Sporosarcina sp. T2O-4]WOV86796.1 hypothetical protein QWT69_13065 [Sporosarcina sp. T2O-4]